MSILQADPSRTSLIRESFERDFQRRINKIGSLVKALLKSKAFGQNLTVNAFCPTGEGGGIDNSCPSRKGKLKDKSGKVVKVFHGTNRQLSELKGEAIYFSPSPGYSYIWNSPYVIEAELKMKNPYYTETLSDAEGIGYWPEFIAELKAKGHDGLIYSKKGDLLKGASGWGNDHPQYVVFSPDQVEITNRYQKDEFRLGIQLGEITTNAFCPTGKGGGVDPTCSPKKSSVKMNKSNWILVHGGSNWEVFDKSRLGTGEPGGIRPLGPGFYGYVATNKKELAKAIKAAKVYAEKYGGGSPTIHLFSVKPPKGSVELRGAKSLPDILKSGEQKLWDELLTKGHSLPSGTQERRDAFDAAWILGKKIGAGIKIKATTLPDSNEPSGGLIEASIHDSSLLKKIGNKSIGASVKEIASILTTNSRWAFESSQSKVDSFEDWLKAKLSEVLDEKDIHSKTDWWQIYIERAYKFGAARAFDQINKKKVPPAEGFLGAKQFFMGSFPKERLKLLIARTYKGIQGLTDSMRNQLTQELTDGMLQGLTYKQIGERLDQKLNIGLNRAKTIARTEIVRAQAEGQLAAIKALGIEQIGIQVEFNTARKPCPKCQKYNKRILSIKEAEGLIPLHPNCRCAFIPYTTPLSSPQKTAKRKSLEASILATKSRKVGKNK